jgi:signal transduction histidine kinase
MKILKNDWAALLEGELQQPYYLKLREFLIQEYRTGIVYPDMHDVFNALHYTSYSETKVVILGLALSKCLAELHGGHIFLKSEKDKGSCFSFTIPLQSSDPAK